MLWGLLRFTPTQFISYSAGIFLGTVVKDHLESEFFKSESKIAVATAILVGLGATFGTFVAMNSLRNKWVEVPDSLANLPKAGRIAAIIASDNFKFIEKTKRMTWVETDDKGKLHEIRGNYAKAWAIARNFFLWDEDALANVKVTKSISKRIFTSFAEEDIGREILNPRSEEYQKYLPNLKSFVQSLQSMGSPYADELSPVIDIVERPQAVEANLACQQGVRTTQTKEGNGAGINGSFYVRNRKENIIGIFKPSELEATSLGSRTVSDVFGIKKSTGYLHERLAYLLDKDHFANIPETVIAEFPKKYFHKGARGNFKGSLQQFVPGCINAFEHMVEYGKKIEQWHEQWQWPTFLSWLDWRNPPKGISPHEIHKIAIFDIRTLNCDRHLGNFLVDENLQIYPIDHGFTLPGKARQIRFNWMYFPQSSEPFSQNDLKYIRELNAEADMRLIKKEYPEFPQKGLFRIKIATMLLQAAASKGLTARQIGNLMESREMDFKLTEIDSCCFEDIICRELIKENKIKNDNEITDYLNKIIDIYKKIYSIK